MKKLLLMAVISLLLATGCKKEALDEFGCKIPFDVTNEVEFNQPQKEAKPGWNPVHIYTMPLTIYYVQKLCDDPYYEATDAKGDTAKFYHSSIQKYIKR